MEGFFAEKGEKRSNKLFEMAGRVRWHENARQGGNIFSLNIYD